MKSVGFLVIVLAVLSLCGSAHAIAVSTAELEPESPLSKLHRSKHLEDMTHIKFNHSPIRYDSASLDSFIRTTCSTHHIPGVATWTSKNGQIIWQQCYGYASLEDSIPVADTTLFMLASISKTFTATAIMQLWERGVFGLDDDINGYLPFNVRNPNYPDSIITFRMLMTHTSSIQDNWTVLDSLYVWGGDSPIPLGSFLGDYLVSGGAYYDSAANFHTWPPGPEYDYCNVAAALLACLVEEIADSFPTYCQDSIFEPLGMYETSWFLAGLDTNNIAVPYRWTGSYYQPYQHYGYPDYPDGQLRTSTLQLARHLVAFMQYGLIDSVRILDSATVELMRTIQYQVTWNSMYGLIWHYWLVGSRWLWGHSGGDYGVRTIAAFCPAESSAVIVVTNGESSSGMNAIMHALFNYALEYGIEEHESSQPIAVILQIAPNPFRHFANIKYKVSVNCRKSIMIYDVTGSLVKAFNLESGFMNNEAMISWNGEDDMNRKLPGGVYFVTLQAGDYTAKEKLLLIR